MDNITTSLNETIEEEFESELTEQAEVVLNHRYYLKDKEEIISHLEDNENYSNLWNDDEANIYKEILKWEKKYNFHFFFKKNGKQMKI